MNDTANTDSDKLTCPECNTLLASGTCPSCALASLLEKGTEAEPAGDVGVPIPKPITRGKAETFGKYRLLERIAAGGMGVVYRAEDTNLGRIVALKMIRGSTFANEAEISRFTIEAEAAARLDHHNIVPIYDVGQIDGQPYYTMKLIEGKSLAAHIKQRDGSASLRGTITYLSYIARAVHHAHQHGILHRDLKPGNILVDGLGVPWLTDFGLAKLAATDSSMTQSSDRLGTPDYMPPEFASGNARNASTTSDVWSLGVILWEIIFGQRPFRGSTSIETMRRIVDEEPARSKGSSPSEDLVTLSRRCLEKNPEKRLQSAGDLADELDRWLRGQPIRARRISKSERLVKWVRRNPAWAALYTALLCGFLSTFFFWQRAESAVDSLSVANTRLQEALAASNATKLAVDARLEVGKDPTRALLLGVEAVESSERQTGEALRDAEESLISVLQQVGGTDMSTFKTQDGDHNDGYISRGVLDEIPQSVSPDGRWLLNLDYTDANNGVYAAVFDMRSPNASEPLIRWKIWKDLSNPVDFFWSADSRYILDANIDGTVRRWGPFARSVSGRIDRSPPVREVGSVNREGMIIAHLRTCRGYPGNSLGFGVVHADPGIRYEDPNVDSSFTWFGFDENEVSVPRAQDLDQVPLPFGYAFSVGITVSPDGHWMLVNGAHEDQLAFLLDLTRPGEIVQLPEEPFYMIAPSFSEDGKWLAFIRGGETVRLYDLRSGSIQKAAATGVDVFGKTPYPKALAISPDSKWLSIAHAGSKIQVAPIETDGDRTPVSLRMEGRDSQALRFSNDGRWLAAGGLGRSVSVWDMDMLYHAPVPKIFRGLPTHVLDVSFSPDDQYLLATGLHCISRRWQLGSEGTLPKVLPGRKQTVLDVAVSPDRRWIASGCAGVAGESGGSVKLTHISGREEHTLADHGVSCTGVAFSPDRKWLASTGLDGTAKVWRMKEVNAALDLGLDPPGPEFVFDMTDTRLRYDRKVEFRQDGILYCSCGDGIVFEWDLNDADPESTCVPHIVHSIMYLLPDIKVSPDGKWLAVCRHGWDTEPQEGSTQRGNMVLVFDISQPGPPVPHLELPASFLEKSSVEFSPDGRWIACGSSGTGVEIWDLTASDVAASKIRSDVSSHMMTGLSFCPNGKSLALGGSDGRIHLWNWQNPQDSRTIHTGNAVITLAWIDDSQLISGGNRGRLSIWQTDTQRLKDLARKTAGRELSESEREQFRIPN